MQASLSSPHPHFESDLNTRPECSCIHLSIHPSVHPSISSFIHALFSPLPSSILLPLNAWYVSFSVYIVIEYQSFCWCVFLNYIFHSISFFLSIMFWRSSPITIFLSWLLLLSSLWCMSNIFHSSSSRAMELPATTSNPLYIWKILWDTNPGAELVGLENGCVGLYSHQWYMTIPKFSTPTNTWFNFQMFNFQQSNS